MMTGIFLVALSWLVFLAAIFLLDYPFAHLLNKKQHGKTIFRDSIWLGLLIGIIAILIMGIFLPLRSATALAIFAVLVVIAASSTLLIHRKQPRNERVWVNLSKSNLLLIAALALALVYLAAAAIGPITNYDSGLYHLGAIKYAGDYGAIPRLANLYFPFGYNTSLYPIGAFLGNGPWSGNGFRLANGFLILLLVIDLALRLAKGKGKGSRLSTGTYFLLIATPLTLVPLVSLSDYWVTSPSSGCRGSGYHVDFSGLLPGYPDNPKKYDYERFSFFRCSGNRFFTPTHHGHFPRCSHTCVALSTRASGRPTQHSASPTGHTGNCSISYPECP